MMTTSNSFYYEIDTFTTKMHKRTKGAYFPLSESIVHHVGDVSTPNRHVHLGGFTPIVPILTTFRNILNHV